jgi:hypothetical protein
MLATDTVCWQHFSCQTGLGGPIPTNPQNLYDQSVCVLDTITLNTFKYRKVYTFTYYIFNYNYKNLLGYMREDTIAKKIYFRESSTVPELLIYDFSKNVGDSVLLTFPNSTSYSGYYKVDSIKLRNERCGLRRHFYLRKHTNNLSPLYKYLDHIESIGCRTHLLYNYNIDNYFMECSYPTQSCPHPWSLGISCKYNDLIKQYQTCAYANYPVTWNKIDSCNFRYYAVGIRENSRSGLVKISPNPANSLLKIERQEEVRGKLEIYITDITGRALIKNIHEPDEKEILINTHELNPGVYFLRIESSAGIYVNEFIISR